ncbi:MAG: hypothetical protein JO296_18530 [Pseudonocardiales bacterium]|nr:hypothetical protein [Pseudonocardiales bacterium]
MCLGSALRGRRPELGEILVEQLGAEWRAGCDSDLGTGDVLDAIADPGISCWQREGRSPRGLSGSMT